MTREKEFVFSVIPAKAGIQVLMPQTVLDLCQIFHIKSILQADEP